MSKQVGVPFLMFSKLEFLRSTSKVKVISLYIRYLGLINLQHFFFQRNMFSEHIANNTHEVSLLHYENLPMQYKEIFELENLKIFRGIFFYIFLIFAQNIDCGYSLEPPRRGGSNEYPQSMFLSKNKKNRHTPAYPSFTI